MSESIKKNFKQPIKSIIYKPSLDLYFNTGHFCFYPFSFQESITLFTICIHLFCIRHWTPAIFTSASTDTPLFYWNKWLYLDRLHLFPALNLALSNIGLQGKSICLCLWGGFLYGHSSIWRQSFNNNSCNGVTTAGYYKY